MRGADRESSRNARWDAVDAKLATDERGDADGEGVWFRRPEAGVKFAEAILPAGDGGNRARLTREIT
jgi:hypothetical protein